MNTSQAFRIRSEGHAFVSGVSIRAKLFLGIILIAAVLMLPSLMIANIAFTKSFRALEDQVALDRVERMALQVSMLVETRIAYAKDNSEWDDALAFFEGTRPDFLSYNFGSPEYGGGAGMVLAFDRKMALIGQQVANGADPSIVDQLDVSDVAGSGLLVDAPQGGLHAGQNGERFFITAHPVLASEQTGISPGWLVFVEPLTEERLVSIGELMGARVSVIPQGAVRQPSENDRVVEQNDPLLGPGSAIIPKVAEGDSNEASENTASVFFLSAIDGGDVGFYVHLPNRLFAALQQVKKNLRILALCAVGVFVVLCAIGFELLVVRRVLALDSDLQAVVDTRDENLRVRVQGRDEIARVADTTNRMLSTLAQVHNDVVAEHELLESVLYSVGEAVLAVTPIRENGDILDFRVAASNAAAVRYLDSAAAPLAGVALSTLRGLGDMQLCISNCVTVMQSGKSMSSEIQCPHADSLRWIRLSLYPWASGVVLTFEDVSARKESERVMAESLDDLQRITGAMMGREDRVLELKQEIDALCKQLHRPPVYETSGVQLEPN